MRSTRIAALASVLTCVLWACSSDPKSSAPNDMQGDSGASHAATGGSSASTGGSHAGGGHGAVGSGSGGKTAAALDAGRQPNTPATDAGTGHGGAGGQSGTGGTAVPGNDGGGPQTACPSSRPDATNTGVPPDVELTVVDHDVTITQDGAKLDAQDIHGFLIIDASNVQVTRTRVRGGTATQNGAGISVRSGTDILISDCEVGLEHPSAWLDGVSGSNMTVRRCNIHGGVDGMKVGSNSSVECNFIHDQQAFDSDPNQNGGPTHNDAIQILSGSKIRIVGNQLLAEKDQNAAIQVTQDFGLVSDLHIEANFADGGGCTFNFSHNGGDSLAVTTLDNRFGRNSFYDCPILTSTKTTLSSSGDVWDDDGSKVPVQTHD